MPWVKGQSGNPGGRPKAEAEVVALARQASPKAIERLVKLVNSDDERVSIAAANSVLDRAFGKPTQMLAGDPDLPPVGGFDLTGLTKEQKRAIAAIRLATDG